MRKLREVLRLSYSAGLSIRKISASTKNQCWQHPKYLEIGRAAENNLAATGGLG